MQARLGITQHLVREGVARLEVVNDASGKVNTKFLSFCVTRLIIADNLDRKRLRAR
jgi:hypothetical protein